MSTLDVLTWVKLSGTSRQLNIRLARSELPYSNDRRFERCDTAVMLTGRYCRQTSVQKRHHATACAARRIPNQTHRPDRGLNFGLICGADLCQDNDTEL
jgi:hypothetical protein